MKQNDPTLIKDEHSQSGSNDRLQFTRGEDFRRALQAELVKRCQKNPRYSLRAFAKNLGVGPSFLSMILASKRTITINTIENLGPKIGLNPKELATLKQNIISKNLKSTNESTSDENSNDTYIQVAMDQFHLISDWYHYAILELISVETFKPEPRFIAKSLGISVGEVNAAVERLVRLNLLKIENEIWRAVDEHSTNYDKVTLSLARRKLQKQVLEKALTSLEEVDYQKRDQTSMTMAIDVTLLPEARKKITKFRREMARFLQKNNKNEVYNLAVALYPLTQLNDNQEKPYEK
jgi:uncharacterized protein (TIGR02147 family)